MSAFDLAASLERAEQRFATAEGTPARRQRSNTGKTRLPAPLVGVLHEMARRQERPPMKDVLEAVRAVCRREGLPVPSRATVYRFLEYCPPRQVRVADLPTSVRGALYNLDPGRMVPGHQLAYYVFNYGDAQAMSYAAGLPWLDLYQASRMRGWRTRSLGVLRAVLLRRKI